MSTVGFDYAVAELENGKFAEIGILRCEQLGRPIIIPGVPLCHEYLLWNELNSKKSEYSPSTPENDSPSNILNILNDDCLMEVFARLSPEDLCAVADTCTRFRENAKKIFPNSVPKLEEEFDWLTFPLIESFLRNFG